MSRNLRPLSTQCGAALLLLVALGGMAGALFLMHVVRPDAPQSQQERQTRQRLAIAREALIGYALQHGRLPRPASSASDGRENPIDCATDSNCSGFIPWVTLGIEGSDSWGKLLRYAVTPAFTVLPILATHTGGNKTVRNRLSDGQFYYVVGHASCPLYAQCPPAVIYSSGKYNLGTSVEGIRLPSRIENNVDERQNEVTSNDFISRVLTTDSSAPGGEFDDLMLWVPPQLLFSRMRAAHALE